VEQQCGELHFLIIFLLAVESLQNPCMAVPPMGLVTVTDVFVDQLLRRLPAVTGKPRHAHPKAEQLLLMPAERNATVERRAGNCRCRTYIVPLWVSGPVRIPGPCLQLQLQLRSSRRGPGSTFQQIVRSSRARAWYRTACSTGTATATATAGPYGTSWGPTVGPILRQSGSSYCS
jgi:hypothetical protein